jgi:ribosomal protein S19
MTPPKVSVCIQVYNGSAHIAESIESVIGQTYEIFQLSSAIIARRAIQRNCPRF